MLLLNGVERTHRASDGGFLLSVPELSVAAGERVVVLGPSGSGKSTLLDLLAFLAAPDRAETFRFSPAGEDHDIKALWRKGDRAALTRLRAAHMGYVLQTGGLLPYLTVRENLLLARRLLGLEVPGPADRLAEAVGVGELLHRMPAQLSIGQRQRVAVIRALAHIPRLILADEPTAALDTGLGERVIDTLVAVTGAIGAALILVTHDEELAGRAQGRIVRCRALRDAETPGSVVAA
ncbi:ABC transporter ATP-binding protein [Skermanella stibiiresistens SB22]|uniref:ABC transporter ATP-binding protein n=1 Tax=Skermanella stibiiresistens SB22 TaxID=1385369 RepID=W9H9N9_9PROT|nr:ABC transporter ATP-binding protein [Skermanella stibiiresistens SB22]